MFSCFSRGLRDKPARSIPELIEILKNSYKPKPKIIILDHVTDYWQILGQYVVPHTLSKAQSFMFSPTQAGVTIKYKHEQAHDNWLSSGTIFFNRPSGPMPLFRRVSPNIIDLKGIKETISMFKHRLQLKSSIVTYENHIPFNWWTEFINQQEMIQGTMCQICLDLKSQHRDIHLRGKDSKDERNSKLRQKKALEVQLSDHVCCDLPEILPFDFSSLFICDAKQEEGKTLVEISEAEESSSDEEDVDGILNEWNGVPDVLPTMMIIPKELKNRDPKIRKGMNVVILGNETQDDKIYTPWIGKATRTTNKNLYVHWYSGASLTSTYKLVNRPNSREKWIDPVCVKDNPSQILHWGFRFKDILPNGNGGKLRDNTLKVLHFDTRLDWTWDKMSRNQQQPKGHGTKRKNNLSED